MKGIVQDIKMIYFDYSPKNIGTKNNNFNNIEYNNYNINYNFNEDEIVNSFILCTLFDIKIIQINKGKINFYNVNNIENNSILEDDNNQENLDNNDNQKKMVIIYPLKGDINPLYIDDNKPPSNAIKITNNRIILMSNNYKSVNFSLIIGYSNGEIEIIDLKTNETKNIDKLSSTIVGIVNHSNVLIVGTAINGIHIYDKNTFKKIYDFQLIELGLKLIGMTLCSMDISLTKLLLLTFEGDAIEIKVDETGYIKKDTAERINSLIKLEGNINSFTIIKEVDNNLIFGGDNGILSYININTNEPSDYFNFGKKITCMDSICLKETGFLTAIGFDSGDVIIRENWDNEINKKNILEKFTNKMITDIKFGKDETFLVVCSQDKNIIFYELVEDKYKKLKSPNKTQDGYPISICFDGDFQKLLILTSNWRFTIIDIKKNQVLSDDDLNLSYWINFTGKYTISQKSLSVLSYNLLIGVKSNFVIASDEKNNLHFWKNPEDIEKNSGQVLRVHTGHIQNLKISLEDEFLITSGLNDHMICKWEIKPIYNDRDNIIDDLYNNTESPNINLNMAENNNPRKKIDVNENDIDIDDLALINELNYSYVDENKKTLDTDLDINISIRGFNNPNLNNIFSSQLNEIDLQTQLLPIPYFLLIEYIYGSHICEKRDSIKYLHSYYSEQNNENIEDNNKTNAEIVRQILNENINKKTINEIIRMLNFSEIYNSSNNNNTIHKNCSKKVIYYLSRYVIIFSPYNSVQKIYQGHKNKISCIAINSKNNLIASGEVAINPYILIWNVNTFETINILKQGIIKVYYI
jgi:WD40 repeat protein